jgi:hypothetical protein
MSVPPAVAGGSTIRCGLVGVVDPPATAGGTDIYPTMVFDL